MKLKKVHKQILEVLRVSSPLTLDEISQNLGMPKKKVFRALRKLFEEDLIKTDSVRHYKLSEKVEKDN